MGTVGPRTWRRWRIALLGIVALVAAVQVLVGGLTRTHFVKHFSEPGPNDPQLVAYERGLFSSRAILSIPIDDAPDAGRPVMELDIHHGPWLPRLGCNTRFGFGALSGQLRATSETPMVRHYFGAEPAAWVCGRFGPMVGSVTEITVPAYQGPAFGIAESPMEVSWSRFTLRIEAGEGADRFRLELPGFSRSVFTQVGPVYRGGWRLYEERSVGAIGLVVDGHRIRRPDGGVDWSATVSARELRQDVALGRDERFLEAHRFTLDLRTDTLGETVDLRADAGWERLVVPEVTLGSGSLGAAVVGLDRAALQRLDHDLSDPQLALLDADQRTRVIGDLIDAELVDLLRHGPEFRLGPLRQSSRLGDFAVSARAQLVPDALLGLASYRQLPQRMLAQLQLELPYTYLHQQLADDLELIRRREFATLTPRPSDFRIRQMAESEATAAIERMVTEGLVARVGGSLRLSANLRGGDLRLNEQLIPGFSLDDLLPSPLPRRGSGI